MKVQRLEIVILGVPIPFHKNTYESGLNMQEEISSSAGQKFECAICNRKFKAITNTHLKKHNITEVAYKKQFPEYSLGDFSRFNLWQMSKENREHLTRNSKLVYSSNELLEKKRLARNVACDLPEYRKKLSVASLKNAKTNKMILVYSNAKNNVTQVMRMSNFDRWKLKFGEEEAIRRQQNWLKNVKLPNKSFGTKCELRFKDMLDELAIDYIQQFRMKRFICDFYLPKFNLIVEIDGDYWHANPKSFKSTDVVGRKKEIAARIWQKDKARECDLKNMNFNVIRYWESSLKIKNAQEIFEDIVQTTKKLVD